MTYDYVTCNMLLLNLKLNRYLDIQTQTQKTITSILYLLLHSFTRN